ncbi:MAG: glycosyltransferase family 2 protein [Bdellovibrionaceae bacterium]|nr:glycosyltransferase family 2 protein [Pseudobdellovibrionaceae bacterium]
MRTRFASKTPLVTVVLACYKPVKEYFHYQVQSLREQTYPNWKCVVYDDCSDEDSFQYIKNFLENDIRFEIHRGKVNLGSTMAFAEALTLVPPESVYIAFCDQDDIWKKNKIEKMVEVCEASGALLVHTDQELIDQKGSLLAKSCWGKEGRKEVRVDLKQLIFRNTVTGCASLFRASLLKNALPFPLIGNDKPIFYHDVWIALHAAYFGDIISIDEPLVEYRQHAGNQVGAQGQGARLKKKKDSFFRRALAQYRNRLFLKNKFESSVRSHHQERSYLRDLEIVSNFRLLFFQGLRISWGNSSFFKTWLLLLVGFGMAKMQGDGYAP